MIDILKQKPELVPHFTQDLLENGYGVVIEATMPIDSYLAIDVDSYYHHIGLSQLPEIADLLIVAKKLSAENDFHIYIVEMKNISNPKGFKVSNLYNKFVTVVDDFMKKRHVDPFLEEKHNVIEFRLFFVSDAYKLKQKGLTDSQIRSFLEETKISTLQSMPRFEYRQFKARIEYQLPNPQLSWS